MSSQRALFVLAALALAAFIGCLTSGCSKNGGRMEGITDYVDAAQAYMGHERSLLEKLTALRARAATTGQGEDRLATEAALTQGVSQLLAVAESYP